MYAKSKIAKNNFFSPKKGKKKANEKREEKNERCRTHFLYHFLFDILCCPSSMSRGAKGPPFLCILSHPLQSLTSTVIPPQNRDETLQIKDLRNNEMGGVEMMR